MFRRSWFLKVAEQVASAGAAAAAGSHSLSADASAAHPLATKKLTPQALLQCIRRNPGLTASYYATRYFPEEDAAVVNHMLWAELKRFGHVVNDRQASTLDVDDEPRWIPNHDRPFRITKVRNHFGSEQYNNIRASAAEDSKVAETGEPVYPPQVTFAESVQVREEEQQQQQQTAVECASTVVSSSSSSSSAAAAAAVAPAVAAAAAFPAGASSPSFGRSASQPMPPPAPKQPLVGAERTVGGVHEAVVALVHKNPGKIISFYTSQLPADDQRLAARAFKELRVAGLLRVHPNATGASTWFVADSSKLDKE